MTAAPPHFLRPPTQLNAYEDFTSFVEAVHHAAAAGDYDGAYELFWRGAPAGEHLLTQRLGAYQVQLAIMREFFPDHDVSREPLVTDLDAARYILHEVGFCLKALGRLTEAEPFFERAYKLATRLGDPVNAGIIRTNHAALCEKRGELGRGVHLAQEAVDLARRARLLPLRYDASRVSLTERGALVVLALLAEVTGSGRAAKLYHEATTACLGIIPYEHAEFVTFLRRTGKISIAREAVAMRARVLGNYLDERSITERLLGDLDAGAKRMEHARTHYDLALSLAQRVDRRDVLLEALIARGRFAVESGETHLACSVLESALKEATSCSFRLYEVDIRLALAMAYRAAENLDAAHREAERARRLAAEIDFYWGEATAADLLRQLEDPAGRVRSADRTRLFQELQRELEETKVGEQPDASSAVEVARGMLTPFFEQPERIQQVLSAGGLTYEAEFLRRRPDYGAVVQQMLAEFRHARDSDPIRCFALWGVWMEQVDGAIRFIGDLARVATEGESPTIVDDPFWAVRSIARIVDTSLQPFVRLRLEMRGLAGMRAPNAAGAASLSYEEVIDELGADENGEVHYRPALLREWLGTRGELPRTGFCVLVEGAVYCPHDEASPWSLSTTEIPGVAGYVNDLWYAHKVAYEIFSLENLDALRVYAPRPKITEHTADVTLAYSLVAAGFRIYRAKRIGMTWEFTLNDRHARGEREVKTALQEATVQYVLLTGPVEIKARVNSGKSSFQVGFRTRLRGKGPDAVSGLFDAATHLDR